MWALSLPLSPPEIEMQIRIYDFRGNLQFSVGPLDDDGVIDCEPLGETATPYFH